MIRIENAVPVNLIVDLLTKKSLKFFHLTGDFGLH